MAGVSTATVSRVINQTAWVEPVTRERVEKAMRDLNYRRNAAAIALAKRSGDMLGLLTGNLADPFFARLARGVEDVSRKQQYRLMVCSGGHDEEMEKAGLDFLVNQGCEAIVVHASRLPDKELLRYAAHFPALVVVNRYIAGMANRCIWLENRRFLSRLDAHGLDVFNALSVQAATTAWNESRQWLDSLLDYLAENRRWFVEQATEHLPWARIVPAQGTYLLWMDCKKLGLDDEQLKWVMADVAGIAPSMGSGFGPAGSGFIRLNLGCPRTYLEMTIDGLKRISVKTIKGIPTGG